MEGSALERTVQFERRKEEGEPICNDKQWHCVIRLVYKRKLFAGMERYVYELTVLRQVALKSKHGQCERYDQF